MPARFLRFLKTLGPGFVAGASDDDPSGIATYAQAGAAFGLATLWTALITFPLMWAIQYTCATIAMVTGRGLTSVIRVHYPRWLLYGLVAALTLANTINAGVDIGAISAAVRLLIPGFPQIPLLLAITAALLALQVWGSYRLIARVFRWLAFVLLAYIGAALFSHPDWGAVLHATVLPHLQFNGEYLTILVAILGTTITPYLFFWQASQEVEEEVAKGRHTIEQRQGTTAAELADARWDVGSGMFFSNVVMYFIILASAAALFGNGSRHHEVNSAADLALALRPLAGDLAYGLFAVGLIGAGFLCVPILTTSAAFAVAESLHDRTGLSSKPRDAKLFYGVIVGTTLAGLALNFLPINPIRALVWTAVINGLLAPPMLLLVMLIATNREIMGRHATAPVRNTIGWITTVVMTVAALALVASWIRP